MRTKVVFIALVVTICHGCGAEPELESPGLSQEGLETETETETFSQLVVADRGGFIPEGVEYDSRNGKMLTGSISEGTIFRIHSDGRVTEFISDTDLVSSVGIEADELRNRLLVANSDREVFQGESSGQAKLGVYDLTTGERIEMVDLAAAIENESNDAVYFANDVAVGDDGTVYVTDTRMNVIYRVSTDYQVSILYRFVDGDDAGPNGIVSHPAGYLLVARGAALWKIPLADSANAVEVTLPEEVPGQDGMVWIAGRLAIVSNSENRVVALTSNDDWATAELVGEAGYSSQATTAAVVDEFLYVVHPNFSDEEPPTFERVVLRQRTN